LLQAGIINFKPLAPELSVLVSKRVGAYFETATNHYFAYAWLMTSAEIGFLSIRLHVN
jgi:hypothetical protein